MFSVFCELIKPQSALTYFSCSLIWARKFLALGDAITPGLLSAPLLTWFSRFFCVWTVSAFVFSYFSSCLYINFSFCYQIYNMNMQNPLLLSLLGSLREHLNSLNTRSISDYNKISQKYILYLIYLTSLLTKIISTHNCKYKSSNPTGSSWQLFSGILSMWFVFLFQVTVLSVN